MEASLFENSGETMTATGNSTVLAETTEKSHDEIVSRGLTSDSARARLAKADRNATPDTAMRPLHTALAKFWAPVPCWKLQLGSNLGPNTDNLGPKPCTVAQNKARRTN